MPYMIAHVLASALLTTGVGADAAASTVEPTVVTAEDGAERFSGVYDFAGGERERQGVRDAVERAVQSLNFMIRGIGRRRLTTVTKVSSRIQFRVDPDTITLYFDTKKVAAPRDGRWIDWTDPMGKPTRISFSISGNTLTQRFKGEDGARTNVFTISEDRQRLRLKVTIRSDRLEEPIVYNLSYGRS